MNERKGIITMAGNPLTLVGNEPKIGEKAPDFMLLDSKLEPKSLKDFAGKIKVISVAPSLDTKVCNLQLHWFNEDMASRPEGVVVGLVGLFRDDLDVAQYVVLVDYEN